jgi:hypothetical protein
MCHVPHRHELLQTAEPEFLTFKEPRNRSKESILPAYVACRTDTITLFVIPAGKAIFSGGIDSLESIPGLLKRLQIRALSGYSLKPHLTYYRLKKKQVRRLILPLSCFLNVSKKPNYIF